MAKCVGSRVENIMGNVENTGHQQFLLSDPQCLQKTSFLRSLKFRILW